MKKIKQEFCIANCVIPIFLGGLLYYLFCPDTLFVMKIDSMLGMGIHFPWNWNSNIILNCIRNYLLDALWAYALVFALYLLQDNYTHKTIRSFMITFVFGIVMELTQLSGVFAGTFDIVDIIVELFAEVAAVLIINKVSYEGRKTSEKI